jgi:hypothetical protein
MSDPPVATPLLATHQDDIDVSAIAVEDLAERAGESLGLPGVSELAAQESAVVAREHLCLLTEQLSGGVLVGSSLEPAGRRA